MITTITLKEIFCGTEVDETAGGHTGGDSRRRRVYLRLAGVSLVLLGKLVEAEIPDQM